MDPGIRLLTKIGDFVEPLTRFDRGHLTLEGSQHVLVDVAVRQTFRVVFEVNRSEGDGDLPVGVTRLADAAELTREIEAQLASSRAQVRVRLSAWAQEHGEDPATKPTVDDCFTRLAPIGQVDTCATCSGQGKIACAPCKGAGTLTCEVCAGKGSSPCATCEAKGEVSCATCKGMGNILTQKERKVWDEAIDAHRIEYVQELAPCGACSGAGKVKCARCGGRTEITCATCHGQKTIPCSHCSGSGDETCQTCHGQGKRYSMANLTCAIRETFELTPRTADPEIAGVLKSKGAIEQVLGLAASHRATAEANADTLKRDTLVVTPVTAVVVQVGGNRAQVRGFGPNQDVLDYRNVAGMLLSDDLKLLEEILPTTSLVPPKMNDTMLHALSMVLASEANATIAANAAKKDQSVLERDFRGVVDGPYIKRAGGAMKTAISRAYWTVMARGPMATLVIPVLIGPIALLTRNADQVTRIVSLLAVMLLTLGAATGAHMWVARKLQTQIARNGVPKIGRLLDKLGLMRTWLIAGAIIAVVLTLAVASLTDMVFSPAPAALFGAAPTL
jgi:hypothetical protein